MAFRALTRTFLRRFFDNEITGGAQDLKASFFWLIAFLAAPLVLMPMGLMIGFRTIVLTLGPEALRVLSRPHKTVVIVLGMTAAGLIAAVVWNSLMLERRDGLILGALPVRGRTIVLSKLAALAIYVFGISAAMHAVSSVLFGMVLADGAESWRSCAFVFLFVTAVQGLALALTGPAVFRRVSPLLQVALVAAIVVAFTQIGNVIQGVSRFNQVGREAPPADWLLLTPPIWFLGLYEWILGNAEPVYGPLAATAVLAFAAVTAVTLATYAVTYRRVMSRVVETSEDSGGRRWVSAIFEWITHRISRLPVRRASAQFLFTSIGRVERLRFVLAVTIGVLCAWIVPALAVIVAGGGAPPTPRTTFALSYAALLLVLIGLRITISMPADLRAAWIGPMIDAPRRALRSGLWRALFLTSVLPVVVSFAAFHAWLWDAGVALTHAGVMLGVGTVLVEMALWHFDDLPSQRPWRPENANLRMWWPAYIVGFTTITGTIPQLEWMVGDSLMGMGATIGTCLVLALALRVAHGRPYPRPSFDIETFVEAPSVLKLD
jgi:ABC-type transport system involved in multi-copper enzyme maturation permease subunit